MYYNPSGYYNRDGEPITVTEWGPLHTDPDYRTVLVSEFKPDWLISTVWLGLNHSHIHDRLLIFETMIFRDGTLEDVYCDRYTTEEEAREGHVNALLWLHDHLEELEKE